MKEKKLRVRMNASTQYTQNGRTIMLWQGQEYDLPEGDAGDFVKNCFAYVVQGEIVHNKSRGKPRKVKQDALETQLSLTGTSNSTRRRPGKPKRNKNLPTH